MPRTDVDIKCTVEHLSILDSDGNVDRELEPDLSDELLLEMHRAMLLSRKFDDKMLSLQSQGRLGTFAPAKGQEAAQVGSAAALRETDWVVPSYRETAVSIWRGADLSHTLVHNAGYTEGGAVGDEPRDLPVSVPVGTQMLHAAGLAYALRMKKADEIVMTYFGDGATSQGDFHEALNFASVFRCPVVFLCQNNQYAISVPRSRQTTSATLAQKAIAYDMPCLQVDGNDVLAVYAAASEAVSRARADACPTLIECVTYRLDVHTTVDDPTKYREEEEVEAWRQRDPIPRFQRYLREADLLGDEAIKRLEDELDQHIAEAVETAEQSRKEDEPTALFEHLVEQPGTALIEQRRRFDAQRRDSLHG